MTNKKEKVGNAFCHIYLIVLSLIAVFPLVWVLLCSVKSSGELTSNPTRFFPKHFTLENFTHVIQDLGFAKNIGNSLIIAIITTGIAIVISSMAAYGIVRFFPKLGSIMSKVLVATYMFPPILLAIPYSMVMAKLGLVNTRIGLIIVYLSFSVPYAVWMLVGFFKTVPLGIEEAAKVDGANKFQTFIQIVLPLVMPGIVATAIYTFINAWNEFLYSLILINSTDKMTVSVALKSLQGAEILNWGDMMAASALVVVPVTMFSLCITPMSVYAQVDPNSNIENTISQTKSAENLPTPVLQEKEIEVSNGTGYSLNNIQGAETVKALEQEWRSTNL